CGPHLPALLLNGFVVAGQVGEFSQLARNGLPGFSRGNALLFSARYLKAGGQSGMGFVRALQILTRVGKLLFLRGNSGTVDLARNLIGREVAMLTVEVRNATGDSADVLFALGDKPLGGAKIVNGGRILFEARSRRFVGRQQFRFESSGHLLRFLY